MTNQFEKMQQFRSQLYSCFSKRAAAAMNLIDALASAVQVESPIGLSESAAFERKYASVYDALGESALDHAKLGELVCKWPVEQAQTLAGYEVYATDSTGNPRPEAECLPERVWLKSDPDTPAVPGQEWGCTVRVLHDKCSWVAPLALQRVPSSSTASRLAAQQARQIHQHTPHTPKVITADSRYANRVFLAAFVGILTLCVLVRLRSNMVLYGSPPSPKPHQRGRPRKHGDKFELTSAQARTRSDRDETIQHLGQTIRLRVWHHLHFQWLTQLVGCVICVEFLRPDHTPRYKRPLWLFWSGPLDIPLPDLCRIYLWRFTIEHFFRFIKQHLGFYATRATLLFNAERWIDCVFLAYWQLVLASPVIPGFVAPWRTTPKPNTPFAFTPRQVQLALPSFLPAIGSPAHPPSPAGKAPGRPLGFIPPPRTHLKPIRKSPIPQKPIPTLRN